MLNPNLSKGVFEITHVSQGVGDRRNRIAVRHGNIRDWPPIIADITYALGIEVEGVVEPEDMDDLFYIDFASADDADRFITFAHRD